MSRNDSRRRFVIYLHHDPVEVRMRRRERLTEIGTKITKNVRAMVRDVVAIIGMILAVLTWLLSLHQFGLFFGWTAEP